jgi:hypothetical protein
MPARPMDAFLKRPVFSIEVGNVSCQKEREGSVIPAAVERLHVKQGALISSYAKASIAPQHAEQRLIISGLTRLEFLDPALRIQEYLIGRRRRRGLFVRRRLLIPLNKFNRHLSTSLLLITMTNVWQTRCQKSCSAKNAIFFRGRQAGLQFVRGNNTQMRHKCTLRSTGTEPAEIELPPRPATCAGNHSLISASDGRGSASIPAAWSRERAW